MLCNFQDLQAESCSRKMFKLASWHAGGGGGEGGGFEAISAVQ